MFELLSYQETNPILRLEKALKGWNKTIEAFSWIYQVFKYLMPGPESFRKTPKTIHFNKLFSISFPFGGWHHRELAALMGSSNWMIVTLSFEVFEEALMRFSFLSALLYQMFEGCKMLPFRFHLLLHPILQQFFPFREFNKKNLIWGRKKRLI